MPILNSLKISAAKLTTKNISWKGDVFLIFASILAFFCIGLGERAYIVPSEARYIEIPRQMLLTGDFITPYLNGIQYFEKPPLFYWLQTLFLSFGNSEFWGRIATSIIVSLICVATYCVTRILYDRRCGWLAASALATSILGYGLSRVAMLDAPVTLFLTLVFLFFLLAIKTGKARFYYLMYMVSALAVMSKGLIGVFIPCLVIGGWILATNNWKLLLSVRLFSGLILFLMVAAPWHMMMVAKHPDFFDFYFIHEHLTRFLTNEHKRTAPWWFFIAVTLAGMLPWLLVIIPRISDLKIKPMFAKAKKLGEEQIFLLLWIVLPLVFFSSSHSKLVPYIFPIFPPLFVLIGKRLSDLWSSRKNIIIAVMCISAFFEISANYVAPQFDLKSIKNLALSISSRLTPNDMVVAYNSYWQDLPVYLGRNVTIVNWQGELAFGTKHTEGAEEIMIDSNNFWNKCALADGNVFVFARVQDIKELESAPNCHLQEISRNFNTVLLAKRP